MAKDDALARLGRPAVLWAAWARVAAGSAMPGADGVSVPGFAARLGPRLEELSALLRSGCYVAQPVRSVLVSRGGRLRQRGIPTVADRVVQRAFLHVFGDRLLASVPDTSFAYQRGRSWVDALRQAQSHRRAGLRRVFRTDIADFFASIDHERLLGMVGELIGDRSVLALVSGWVRAPVLTERGLVRRDRGVPEGAPVSPSLANAFLRGFDAAVNGRYGRLVRYADDVSLFCATEQNAILGAEQILAELAELGLQVNQDKTYLSSFDAGFRMLGWEFRGDTGWPERATPGWTHPLRGVAP